MSTRYLRAGESAVLVELASLGEVLGLHAALRADPLPGVVDLVPAARTVLVQFDPARTAAEELVRAVRALGNPTIKPADTTGEPVELACVYEGEDLAEVARLSGLTERDVVERHSRAAYVVAFCGFAPGFAYLAGGDPALRVPRRDSPRTVVPAGSVALADEFTGVYPRRMPGGWQLVGHTDAVLFDVERDPPALLPAGTRVRFVERSP
ncbi:MAG: allophanate hydrolase subunit 1 [Mycobacteriales bacterium]